MENRELTQEERIDLLISENEALERTNKALRDLNKEIENHLNNATLKAISEANNPSEKWIPFVEGERISPRRKTIITYENYALVWIYELFAIIGLCITGFLTGAGIMGNKPYWFYPPLFVCVASGALIVLSAQYYKREKFIEAS